MLHVRPEMLPRLDIIETDLRERRDRAEAETWLGEIEGIDLTLQHVAAKRQQAQRLTGAAKPVLVGMPTLRDAANEPT